MIASQPFLRATLAIAATGGFVSSLELLAIRDAFRENGLLSWRVVRLDRPKVMGLLGIFGFLMKWPGIQALIAARSVAALVCAIWCMRGPAPLSLIAVYMVLGFLLTLRAPLLVDGAERMMNVAVVTCFLAGCVGGEPAGRIGLCFLAAQLSLAYSTSGIVKIGVSGWKRGRLPREILSTVSFGRGNLHASLSLRPHLGRSLALGLIVGELLWGFAPWVPPRLAFSLIACALLFHLTAAAVMGLNTFLFAFTAAFPAAVYTSLTLYS
jgi:hypothetical protein